MKNILTIENGTAILLSNVDDGTNTIFINGAEIPASSWVGSGAYQYTESGVTFTIQKTNANTGNIMLQLVQGTAYRLVKQFEGEPYNSGDPLDTDLADEDYMPFYDASTGRRKNSLWSNIVDKINSDLTNQVNDMNNVLGAKNFVEIEDFTLLKSTNRTKLIYMDTVKGVVPERNVILSFTVSNSNLTQSGGFHMFRTSGRKISEFSFKEDGNYQFEFDATNLGYFYIFISNADVDTATCTISDIMIRLASITDDTYEPYAKTNQQLTEDTSVAYKTTDIAETDLANDDYVPFYDTSAGAKKNSLWSNIVDKLKDIFVKKSGDTMSGNLTIDKKNGTPNVEAWSYVMLGNDTPVTQDKNSTGVIRFFTQGTSYIDLVAAKTDAVRYQQLQNKSGTIALLSDTNPFVSINNKTTLAEVGAVIDDAFNDLGNNVGALWGYCFANTCSALGWWESGATLFCISNSATLRQAVFLCNGSPSIRIIYKNEGVWRELDNNGFAPYPHAVNSTHYGGGNDTNYGHVKLSDSYTTSGGAASASVAASSKAVADLYSAIRNRNGSVATTTINSSTAPGIIVHPAFLGFFGNIRVNRTSATEIVSGTYNGTTNRYAPLLSLTAANAQAILANKMPTTTGPINPIFVTPSGLSSSASALLWFLYRKDANTYYILNNELSAANDTELNAKLNGKDYIYKIVGQCLFKY